MAYVYAYLRAKDSANGTAGTPYYIGKGVRRRAWDREHAVKLPSDPQRIVIIADNLTVADALQTEMLLIALYGRLDCGTGCLRNGTDGGDGCRGAVRSQQTRDRLRAKTLKEWEEKRAAGYQYPEVSEATRAKFRSAKLGRKLSTEHKAKIGQAHRGRKVSDETLRKMSAAQKGHAVSDATRAKISAIQKGRPRSLSQEGRAALIRSLTGRPVSEETRRKISEAKRRKKEVTA